MRRFFCQITGLNNMDNPVLCECEKNVHNRLEAVVEANDGYGYEN